MYEGMVVVISALKTCSFIEKKGVINMCDFEYLICMEIHKKLKEKVKGTIIYTIIISSNERRHQANLAWCLFFLRKEETNGTTSER